MRVARAGLGCVELSVAIMLDSFWIDIVSSGVEHAVLRTSTIK